MPRANSLSGPRRTYAPWHTERLVLKLSSVPSDFSPCLFSCEGFEILAKAIKWLMTALKLEQRESKEVETGGPEVETEGL